MQLGSTARPAGVAALRDAYARGLRPREVVDGVLERIADRNGDAVWISLAEPEVLRARAAELEERADGPLPPLYGIPFAVKDNIDVAGLPTTAACPTFAYSPAADATAVRRLLDAGAIAIGKTNLDQFATGLTGVRSPYGACESVFGGDLVSGGSSSGSAVAVAAGLVAFALGTDTAGSGRVPAAMNGIVGLKPTRGLVSTAGVVPACRSLDRVSIFANDLDDAATVLDVLAAPDPADPWSRHGPWSRPASPPVRVAIAEELDFEGDTAYAAAFAAVVAHVRASAGAVVETPLGPLLEAGDLLYGGPWVAERLAELDGFLREYPGDVLRSPARCSSAAAGTTPSQPSAPATVCRNCGPGRAGCSNARMCSCCPPSRRRSPAPRSPSSRSRAISSLAGTRSSPTCSISPPSPCRRGPPPTAARSASPCSGPRSPRPG